MIYPMDDRAPTSSSMVHQHQQQRPRYRDEVVLSSRGSRMTVPQTTTGHGFPHSGVVVQGGPMQRDGAEGHGMMGREHASAGLSHESADSQLHRSLSHPGPSTFMGSDGTPFYTDSHEPHFSSSDFVQYPPEERHPGADMYLPGSPGDAQGVSPQQSHQPHLQHRPQSVHQQHLLVGGHGMAPQINASPHHSDRSGPAQSPLMGTFSVDGTQLGNDAGIAPSMLMGDTSHSEHAAVPAGADAGRPTQNGNSMSGSWFRPDSSSRAT